jgi:putative adenylate-forming enzyme
MFARLFFFLLWYVRTKWLRRFRTRDELVRWQERRVKSFLRFVIARSPFYRRRFEGRALSEWRTLPTIDKAIMMEHFTELNTRGIDREQAFELAQAAERTRDFQSAIGDVTVGLSSGTSGNRGLFLVTPREQSAWAGTLLAKVLPDPLHVPQRIALFLRANSNLYESVRSRRMRFAFFDLLEPVEALVEKLNAFQPTILASPPSMLRFLAEAKEAGKLRVAPKKILSVAEVLDPLDEAKIAAAFGQKVHQIYQCTEGFLAVTCAEGTLHVNEDLVVIEKEPIGPTSHRRFVPIVTDFTRTTQPIIRYRLNDVLTERADPCPCGSPFLALERIEGRCDDVLYLPSEREGARLLPVFADFVTRAIVASTPAIEEYVVRQHGPRDLEVALRVRGTRHEIEEQVRGALFALFARVGCEQPSLRFSDALEGPGVKKLRRVQRSFKLASTP